VPGIGNELCLLTSRERQGREHGVEAAGKSRELVVAVVVDRRGKILSCSHMFGCQGQVLDGAHACATDRPAEPGCYCNPAERYQYQHQAEECERIVDGRELVADLDDNPRDRGRHAGDAVLYAVCCSNGLDYWAAVRAVFEDLACAR
jgi:hypothetical protein